MNKKIIVTGCQDCWFCTTDDKQEAEIFCDLQENQIVIYDYTRNGGSPDFCPLRQGNVEIELKLEEE